MTDWLLMTLLATSGLVLLVLLIREPVRKAFGSRVTYALWLVPVARLFMPTLTRTVERSVPAGTFLPMSDPMARESLWMARVAPTDPSLLDRIGGWPNLLIVFWLAVAAGLFLSRLFAYQPDRRAILLSSTDVGRSGSVRVIRSAEVASPIALGIFDRLIVIPVDFERLYAPPEQRLVLEHELAHHDCGDLVANLFAFVLLCLQWFNPLAWVAHAAFRFDQEAACDARVLDKVSAGDRADYGRAIAKAASGRALLFASALDRHHSLHRRLKSMVENPKPVAAIAGKLVIVAGIAVALPLTASRAVDYVDIPEPVHAVRMAAAVVPPVPPAAVVQAAAAAAVPPRAPSSVSRNSTDIHGNDLTISGDFITIDGQRKRWEDLTPAEKQRVRASVEKARAAIANIHIDRERIMQSVDSIPNKVQIEKIGQDVARAQANVGEAMRNLEAHREQLRKVGFDPSVIEGQVQQAMKSAQIVDVRAIQRSLSAVDPAKIARSVDGAQQGVERAKVELDRLQARMDADRQ